MKIIIKIYDYLIKRLNYFLAFNWIEFWLTLKNTRKLNHIAITEKSILMIEPNEFHAEILPGFCYYWNKLGYKVFLVVRHKNFISGVFSNCKTEEIPEMHCIGHYGIKYFIKKSIFKSFDYTFITSTRLANKYGYYGLFSDYLGYLPEGRKGYFLVEHNFDSLKPYLLSGKYDPKRIFLLNEYSEEDYKIPMLNPNYFGEINIPKKQDETIFITIGTITERNRNFSELLKAINLLKQEGIANFKIQVIGRADKAVDLSKLPAEVEVLGYLSFQEMYQKLEKAHFFLPLLDPNIKGHQRYLKGETTGSWQLCLGFVKPPIIRTEFADTYSFSISNAILYEKERLYNALIQACNMDTSKYNLLLNEIENSRNSINLLSVNNLKKYISNG